MIKDRLLFYIDKLEKQLKLIKGEDFEALDFISAPDMLQNDAIYINDHYDARDFILEQLEDHGAFQVDIIYYHKAHQYLAKHQAIEEALEIAEEWGYEIKDLNSEMLASLHASQESRNEFLDLSMEIFENIAQTCQEYQNELNNE